jgi:hypothetical protein
VCAGCVASEPENFCALAQPPKPTSNNNTTAPAAATCGRAYTHCRKCHQTLTSEVFRSPPVGSPQTAQREAYAAGVALADVAEGYDREG